MKLLHPVLDQLWLQRGYTLTPYCHSDDEYTNISASIGSATERTLKKMPFYVSLTAFPASRISCYITIVQQASLNSHHCSSRRYTHSFISSAAYLLTYLLTYLLACLLTYLLTYLLAYFLAYLLTYLLA